MITLRRSKRINTLNNPCIDVNRYDFKPLRRSNRLKTIFNMNFNKNCKNSNVTLTSETLFEFEHVNNAGSSGELHNKQKKTGTRQKCRISVRSTLSNTAINNMMDNTITNVTDNSQMQYINTDNDDNNSSDNISLASTTLNQEVFMHAMHSLNSIIVETSEDNKQPKNIDIHSTVKKNDRNCILCKCKSKDLTNHYVQKHKTESYISRLTKTTIKKLRITPNIVCLRKSTSNENLSYCGLCPFCEELIFANLKNFQYHLSAHTGEYPVQCMGCKILRSRFADIFEHQNKSKRCINKGTGILYTYPDNPKIINLFCCKLCNFVQLKRQNTVRHLREQHGMFIFNNIERITALASN